MKTAAIVCALSFCALGANGCVSKGKYDQAVAQTYVTRAELAKSKATLEQTTADLHQRRAEIATLKAELDQLSTSSDRTRALGSARIAELQRRLTELQAAQTAVEARAALYRDLSRRLGKQIDDGDLAIVVRDGRMVLQLPNDVLFDTGRTELKPAGTKALEAIGEVLKTMPQRHFQIAGHTDNVPIHTAPFASNWELSSGRALRVVHFLRGRGVSDSMLSAAGYADVDPVASNDTPDGKRKNRRTEITLQPNIDELVKIP